MPSRYAHMSVYGGPDWSVEAVYRTENEILDANLTKQQGEAAVTPLCSFTTDVNYSQSESFARYWNAQST
jgi:hypothetical protein